MNSSDEKIWKAIMHVTEDRIQEAERNGQERNGQERNGQERNGQERNGQERNGQERNGQEKKTEKLRGLVKLLEAKR